MFRSTAAGLNAATSFVGGGSSVLTGMNEARGIRDVRAFNLDDELRIIGRVIERYDYVAVDTEFPGVVRKVISRFHSREDYHYQSPGVVRKVISRFHSREDYHYQSPGMVCKVLSRFHSREDYHYQSPGVVFKVISRFHSREDYHYQSLRSNVNMLMVI